MSKRYVSMQEASELLQVSYKTIQRKVKDGTFKSRKKGNSREILFESLGLPEDKIKDIDRDTDKTKSETSPNDSKTEKEPEQDFYKEIIRNQQKQIDSQNERISEVNKLILGVQGQLAELNRTLQLSAGTRTEETDSKDIDLRQQTDTNKTEKDKKSENKLKNEALQGSKKPLKVLLYVLIPLVVILTIVGLMVFKVIPIPHYLSNVL